MPGRRIQSSSATARQSNSNSNRDRDKKDTNKLLYNDYYRQLINCEARLNRESSSSFW